MKFEYRPSGVCSQFYTFDIEENIIKSLDVIGGCQGNLRGISRIVVGMNIDDVIKAFEGVDCHGKGTSCPDQISRALKAFKETQNQ